MRGSVRKRVEKQLRKSNPTQMGFWFLERSLILLSEAGVPLDQVIEKVKLLYPSEESGDG